jgi:crossover junction endodeoxyribonuclease RusA
MIRLTLPYPVSANVYWRSAVIMGRAQTFVSKEAKDYREQVGWICKAAGIRAPITGRVELAIQLYPHQPKDWAKRQRKEGPAWDDGVMCLDLDNANKVLLDSIKGIVIEDDKWVRKITSERMVPDGEARVVLFVRSMSVEVPADLLSEAA